MATITFEVSKTGTAEYFMEDDDYEILINEYGGDVKKFIKELDINDSYVDYYEYDINDIDYKDEEIKSLKSKSCLNCEYRDFRSYAYIYCDFFEMQMPKDIGYCSQYKPDKEKQ